VAHTDVIVLGAGIVGTSCAVHLAKRGLSVALIDRGGAGEGTSYGNTGIITGETLFPPAFPDWRALLRVALKRSPQVNYHLGSLPRLAPWLAAFAAASRPSRLIETARVMREAGVKEGLPADAIGCMASATIEGTETLMKHKQTAVILATGGIGLVRAAYSSGKPAFGVGPGNVPVCVERTADIPKAVQDILTGKCFDNGTICASEQAVICDAPVEQAVREQFKLQGAHFLSAAEADQLGKVVATPQRSLNPAIVGRSVEVIAKLAGLSVPPGTRCLIADVAGVGRDLPGGRPLDLPRRRRGARDS